jgi:hypothetical protein
MSALVTATDLPKSRFMQHLFGGQLIIPFSLPTLVAVRPTDTLIERKDAH